jgi:hypothetical protein
LRKRNYHVGGKVGYRMDTKVYSNEKARKTRSSFHVEQTANWLRVMLLRRFGGDRRSLTPTTGSNRCVRLV